MQYSAGDILKINFPEFKHYGVYTDTNSVIHNSKKAGHVEETTIEDFAENREISVSAAIKPVDPMSAVEAARQYLGVPYDLFSGNCEHFVRMVCGLEKESKQVQQYMILVLGIGVALETDSDILKIAGSAAALAASATPENGNPVKNAAIAAVIAAGIAFLAKKK